MKKLIDTDEKTVYVPVSVEDELPPINESVRVSYDGAITFPNNSYRDALQKFHEGQKHLFPTHWLKEVPCTDASGVVEALREAKAFTKVALNNIPMTEEDARQLLRKLSTALSLLEPNKPEGK